MRIKEAHRVARRALCLVALVTRANAEYNLRPAPGDVSDPAKVGDKAFALNLEKWLNQEGLWEDMSPKEQVLLKKPIGSWAKQEIADRQWREEALLVLLWSLSSSAQVPPYDQIASTSSLMDTAPRPQDSQTFIKNAKLRSTEEITKARDVAELWLWRARTTKIIKQGVQPPKGYTFEKIISITVEKATKDGLFQPIEGDFPAFHKPYAKLTDEEWQTMNSIGAERLYGLNWLCGYSDDWDEVPLET